MFMGFGLGPSSWFHSQLIGSLGTDKAYELVIIFKRSSNFLYWFRAMKRDAKTVAGWDFERIIPCHGVRHRYLEMLNHCVYFIFSLWLRMSLRRTRNKLGRMPSSLSSMIKCTMLLYLIRTSWLLCIVSLVIWFINYKPGGALISVSMNLWMCICAWCSGHWRLLRYRGEW